MKNSKNIVMSTKELEKGKVIVNCIAGKYTINEASQLLNVSERHVCRLKNNVRSYGVAGLSHQLRGKESNRKLSEEKTKEIVNLINEKY